MDIKEYIASGILENYVFGTTSTQEKQEVECLSHIYPEIKDELTGYQQAIENIATKYAINPPIELKSKILALIKTIPQEKESSEDTKIIPLNTANQSKPIAKFLAAASIAALIGVGAYTLFLRNDVANTESQLAELNSTYDKLNSDYNELNSENASISDQMAAVSDQISFLRDVNTQKVELKGTPAYENNLATVFWNNQSEKVFLDIKNLPQTSLEESYQLWVLVDGVPQDMGVFDFEINSDSLGLLEMKSTKNADAFAITREPKGGSISPTLENLHVIGTI